MAHESGPIRNIGFAPDLPSSPWATRFPSKLGLISGKSVNHSALVPFPRVDDPVYYDQDPVGEHPRDDAELDKGLISEVFQRNNLMGLLTWEAAVINRHLFFSPGAGPISGGHQLIDKQPSGDAALGTNEERNFSVYQRERIKVDETKWFHFLRKDRWFDWSGFDSDFSKQQRRHWSVDDPKIWEFLRVSLELANRMLKSLIMDRNEGATNIIVRPTRVLDKFQRHICSASIR
ncbi:hypothetical protein F5B22DRAFT_92914 [Xylaria bambusicola]|uniref:uncharacterized protein n=1 Tax=Xylaria bambusicola TaxID=326684 RepID=UPI0020088F37|nr:uncharacterized protein F5B22DRAFT_92914 [Xylaria bambusicola]KAI0518122.1 hypothetical protein F5B22DRAFT_92914 [Xylaria bambusicola]